MKAYHGSVVLRNDGTDPSTSKIDLNAGISKLVTVRINSTQALASIFDLDEVPTANPLTTTDNGNYSFKANDNIYDIIINEGGPNEEKLEKVEISESIAEFGSFIYNDLASSVINYGILIGAVNNGSKINFVDDLYIEPSGSTTTKDAYISCKNGATINWIGTGTVFKFEDGLSLHDSNTKHVVEAGEFVNYADYVNNDGLLDTIEMRNFDVTGSLNIKPSTGLDLDPTVVDFGVNKLIIKDGTLDSLQTSLAVLNSTPYKLVDVGGITVKNQKGMVISLPAQNFHPFYNKIRASMEKLVVDGITIKNDRGVFASAVGSIYAGAVLWEGNEAQFDNIDCEGLVTDTGSTFYDVYMAGFKATHTNGKIKDCWSFNSDLNTPWKLKKCLNVKGSGKEYTFSDDFFSYWETNHSLLLSGSSGNPFTLDLEGEQGFDYHISNCHLIIPNASPTSTTKGTQLMVNWSLLDSFIAINGGGSSYFMVPKWDASTPDVSKSIIAKGNTIVTNGTSVFNFLHLLVENGTPDGGVIDISDNNITDGNGGFVEVLISTDTNAIDTVLDSLTIDNKVYTSGGYKQINDFSRIPAFRTVKLGSDISLNTTTQPSTNSGMFGEGLTSGKFKVTNKGTEKTIDIFTYSDPARSKIGNHTVLLTGNVSDDFGARDFSTLITVVPNEGASTIDFTFLVLGGVESTITWSGSSVNLNTVDIGGDINEPLRLVMERFSDFAKFRLEYKSGSLAVKSVINWDISLT